MATAAEIEILIRARDEATARLETISKSLGGLNTVLLAAGAAAATAAVAIAGSSMKMAADYETMTTNIRNNTNMSNDDFAGMNTAIQKLAVEGGTSFEQLGKGFMHATNLGYDASTSVQILEAAMKSAKSTGGDVGQTTNALALVMKEFAFSGGDAGKAMDVLHETAAQGNMTLEDMVESSGRAMSTASNFGASLNDVGAALAAMTRHGFDASEASTQLTGILTHINNPSRAAKEEIAQLSKATGIDLTRDFGAGAVRARGLANILDDLAKATHGHTEEITKMIPALKGGQGAMALAGVGADDFHQILGTLDDVMAGKLTPTEDAWARTTQTAGFQFDQLKMRLQEMGLSLGSVLLPYANRFLGWLMSVGPTTEQVKGAIQAFGGALGDIADFLRWLDQVTGISYAVAAALSFLMGILGTLRNMIQALASGDANSFFLTLSQTAYNLGLSFDSTKDALTGFTSFLFGTLAQAIGRAQTLLSNLGIAVGEAFKDLQAGDLSGAFKTLGNALAPLGEAFVGLAGKLTGWIGEQVKLIDWRKVWANLLTVGKIWIELERQFLGLYVRLGLWIGAQVALIDWGAVWANISATAIDWGSILGSAIGDLGDWITRQAPVLVSSLTSWGAAFKAWVGPAIQGLMDRLPVLVEQMEAWLTSNLPRIIAQLALWTIVFWVWVAKALPPLLIELAKLLGTITEWIVLTAVPALVTFAFKMSLAMIKGILIGLATLAKDLWSVMGPQIDILWASAKVAATDLGTKIWAAIINGIKAIGSTIADLATWLGARFTEWWEAAKAAPLALGTKILGAIVDGIKAVAGWIADLATWLGDRLGEWLAAVKPAVMALGGNIITGIIEGIKAAPGALKDAIFGLLPSASDIIARFRGSAPAASAAATAGTASASGAPPGGAIDTSNPAVARAAAGVGGADRWVTTVGGELVTLCEGFVEDAQGFFTNAASAKVVLDQARAKGVLQTDMSQIRPGDKVLYEGGGASEAYGHAAVYAGGGQVIDVRNPSVGPQYDPLNVFHPAGFVPQGLGGGASPGGGGFNPDTASTLAAGAAAMAQLAATKYWAALKAGNSKEAIAWMQVSQVTGEGGGKAFGLGATGPGQAAALLASNRYWEAVRLGDKGAAALWLTISQQVGADGVAALGQGITTAATSVTPEVMASVTTMLTQAQGALQAALEKTPAIGKQYLIAQYQAWEDQLAKVASGQLTTADVFNRTNPLFEWAGKTLGGAAKQAWDLAASTTAVGTAAAGTAAPVTTATTDADHLRDMSLQAATGLAAVREHFQKLPGDIANANQPVRDMTGLFRGLAEQAERLRLAMGGASFPPAAAAAAAAAGAVIAPYGTTAAQVSAYQQGRGGITPIAMQHGAIAWRPTLALIGENGPERVTPLRGGGGGGDTYQFIFNQPVYGVASLQDAIVQAIDTAKRRGRA